MWTATPLFGIIIGFILSSFALCGTFWVNKQRKTGEKYTCPLFTMIRAGFFAAFSYYGILFLDIVIKVGFLGMFGYGNFSYQLGSLILLAIFGTILLIGSVFTAPTWKSLVTFGIILSYSIYYLDIAQVSSSTGEDDILYIPMLINLGILIGSNIIFTLIEIILNQNPSKTKLLWDLSSKFQQKINPNVLLILWILFSIEMILNFEGLGLLFWLF